MFGIDFSEIVVIFAIALVVLGPERLPKLAATIGRWVGRARLMARQFREQLEQEANRLHDNVDLSAAQRSAHSKPGHGGSPQESPAPAEGNTPPAGAAPTVTDGQQHEARSSESAAPASGHDSAPEFGLHNAGIPDAASSAHDSGAAEPPIHAEPHATVDSAAPAVASSPQERPVAVEAHER